MTNKLLILISFIFFVSCKKSKYEPTDLTILSEKEQIQRIKNKEFTNAKSIVYKNQHGEELTFDSIYKLSNNNDWMFDVYVNEDGVIKEKVIRKANESDRKFLIQLRQAYNFQPPVEIIKIDCDKIPKLLDEIYLLDQNMRKNGGTIDPDIDRENLVNVISLIENCGMPTLNEISRKQMSAIWLVFQHADNQNRRKYLPILEKSANNGDIRKSSIAMMKDRILMDDGEPQIYGTQVVNNGNGWELYDLINPESVNKRRAEIGFEPLEDYLSNWNIEFDIKQTE
jgi:hypothetical protein